MSGGPVHVAARRGGRVLSPAGGVQPAIAPLTAAAAARVLAALGSSAIAATDGGCCGAVSYHLTAHQEGLQRMRANIDAWWPAIEHGVEAIVVTASACAEMVKEYGELLADDARYAERAARVSALARDLGEIVAAADPQALGTPGAGRRIAFHSPCTLQHGQRLPGVVEGVLSRLGFELQPVADGHLCCGSAGTYSMLQPEISNRLRARKVAALQAAPAEAIATANIGCLVHLQGAAQLPVRHWIELLDPQPLAG